MLDESDVHLVSLSLVDVQDIQERGQTMMSQATRSILGLRIRWIQIYEAYQQFVLEGAPHYRFLTLCFIDLHLLFSLLFLMSNTISSYQLYGVPSINHHYRAMNLHILFFIWPNIYLISCFDLSIALMRDQTQS